MNYIAWTAVAVILAGMWCNVQGAGLSHGPERLEKQLAGMQLIMVGGFLVLYALIGGGL